MSSISLFLHLKSKSTIPDVKLRLRFWREVSELMDELNFSIPTSEIDLHPSKLRLRFWREVSELMDELNFSIPTSEIEEHPRN